MYNDDIIQQIRNYILIRGTTNIIGIIDTIKFIIPHRIGQRLFNILHNDKIFVQNLLKLSFGRHILDRYIILLPPNILTLDIIISVLCIQSCDTKYLNNIYNILDNLKLIKQLEDKIYLQNENNLQILNLIIEEYLTRIGIYTGSGLPRYKYVSHIIHKSFITAEYIFHLIPSFLLQGHHLKILCNCYDYGSKEWIKIMQRAVNIMHICQENCKYLYHEWNKQWLRKIKK
tara:strand:- start:298 stop:987 length:690 start_codon:yes stop_codon:yes gene_type:complete